MEDNTNILGCTTIFMSGDSSDVIFRNFMWGEKGICVNIKKLKHKDYGKDLLTILFKFYINPIQYLVQNLKEYESYRKKEKSIALTIIVNNENFFSKSEEVRYNFIQQSILQKLDLLSEIISKKKLDANLDLLKSDLQRLLL